MLTRRGFAGFASCAICAVTGFVASDASAAEGAPTPVMPGLTRKMLSQMDGPMPGYVTLNMEVEIEAGAVVPRHTHPGIESSYVLEGGFELPIQGQPIRMLKAGDGFQIPPETPHAGGKPGDKRRQGLRSPMSWRKVSRWCLRPEARVLEAEYGLRATGPAAIVH